MARLWQFFVPLAISGLLAGCSGSSGGGGGGAGGGGEGGSGGAGGGISDPCHGQELPECPEACPDDSASLCGQPCSEEGATCGNEIGDGMTCTGGTWGCVVHPPLGEGCNLVCRPLCAAQDAYGEGACEKAFGVKWNGQSCEPLGGCTCIGADCDDLAGDIAACDAAHASCT